MHLYDLSHWFFGPIIVGGTTLVGVAAFVLFKRWFARTPSDAQLSAAMAVLPIVATVHSLLLAFAAVSVWESYSAAESSVVEEADVIAQLSRDLAVFGTPQSTIARRELRDYVRTVIEREWPELRSGAEEGPAIMAAWEQIDDLFRAVSLIEPDTSKREVLLAEVWSGVNELVKLRRDRLYASGSHIPTSLWSVALIGALLTLVIAFVWPADSFHVGMIAALSFSIGLVFYLLLALDRPFAGRNALSPAPFESALVNIERWDRHLVD